ncbi:MAG TPA: DoxX family protein [Bryobacteraceae bacterium]|nr:DoxX family protein [Bryobacteraceae bacterium]
MFEGQSRRNSSGALTDWVLRGGVAAAFAMFGAEKFSDPQWVKIFQQIGYGQWFRGFSGVVEILGGLLVLLPWTVTPGLALLGGTMFSAALIWIFMLGQGANAIIPGAFGIALVLFWVNRRGLSASSLHCGSRSRNREAACFPEHEFGLPTLTTSRQNGFPTPIHEINEKNSLA